MYENFKTEKDYFISNKIYLNGKWFLEKEIISTWGFHPVFKELINFKIHLGELFPEGYEYIEPEFVNGKLRKTKYIISLDSRLSEDGAPKVAVNEDFTNELNKYTYEPYSTEKGYNTFYIYVETFKKGIKLPEYYSLILFDDNFDEEQILCCSINKQNDYELLYFFNDGFDEKLICSDVDNLIKYSYFEILENLSEIIKNVHINQIIEIDRLNYISEKITEVKKTGCLFYKYSTDALNSIIDYLTNKKIILKCECCGVLFEYVETKKYCSENCKIKAKNNRYYSKNSDIIKQKRILK